MKFIQILLAIIGAAAIVYFGLDAMAPTSTPTTAVAKTHTTPPARATTLAAATQAQDPAPAVPHAQATAQSPTPTTTQAAAPVAAASAGATKSAARPNGTVSAAQAQQIAQHIGLSAAQQTLRMAGATSTGVAPATAVAAKAAAPAGGGPPASAPATQTAARQPKSTPTSTRIPSPAPATTPAPATRATSSPRSTARRHAESHSSHTEHRTTPHRVATMPEPKQPYHPLPPAAAALRAWWAPSGTPKADGFRLVYAGEASFTNAIVLLFSKPVQTSAADHIRVIGDHGKTVTGTWSASDKNPRMLIFKTKPGPYTVVVPGAVKDTEGGTLGTGRSGPVYVHAANAG